VLCACHVRAMCVLSFISLKTQLGSRCANVPKILSMGLAFLLCFGWV